MGNWYSGLLNPFCYFQLSLGQFSKFSMYTPAQPKMFALLKNESNLYLVRFKKRHALFWWLPNWSIYLFFIHLMVQDYYKWIQFCSRGSVTEANTVFFDI